MFSFLFSPFLSEYVTYARVVDSTLNLLSNARDGKFLIVSDINVKITSESNELFELWWVFEK